MMKEKDKLLEYKKDTVIEMMKLGMDFDTACVAAEVDDTERDILETDKSFIGHINYTLALKEKELLEKFSQVAEKNLERGDTRQIERQLELLNPERYSKVTKLAHTMGNDTAKGGKVTIEFAGEKEE